MTHSSAALAPPEQLQDDEILIKPSRGWIALNLREVWRYRELLFHFMWRDIKVRYKQTILGFAWAILNPIANMILFSLIFGGLAQLDSEGVPYPIFSYAALLPWTFFASGLTRASNVLIGNSNLITKVYFPRLILPISAVAGGLPDLGLSFMVMVGLMIYYGVTPNFLALLVLPLLLLLASMVALGVGMWLSALNIKYRDVSYINSYLIRFWMYATPVVYSLKEVQSRLGPFKAIYSLNPMVSVIDGFRWALLDRGRAPDESILLAIIVALLLLVSGAFYFRRMEKMFADLA